MASYPKTVEKLIEEFSRLPGVGSRTAERFALHLLRVPEDEALELANSTSYKLTGGVFNRRPSHLELARRQFRVGNLYLNRGITGALVGRQPFGGFGLSGTGTKAGGIDYLLHFVEPRCATENTMRHGFAPGLD